MIDTYFKQYFWSFQLLILGISAFLVARTVNAFIGNALQPTAVDEERDSDDEAAEDDTADPEDRAVSPAG